MDLTSDIPDFVRDSFVPADEHLPEPVNNTFESKWKELGSIVLGMMSPPAAQEQSFAFSCIRLSDIIDALGNCVTDEHHLWISPSLAASVRLTTWSHIKSETHFYELAATLGAPTLIFAFEANTEAPRSFFYGPQELVVIPKVVTASTFVFLLQRVQLSTVNNAGSVSTTFKKKRIFQATSTEDESDEEVRTTTCVQSVEIEQAPTNIPVVERQRMGTAQAQQQPLEVTFDLHEIMSKWKRDNKRPTVEKICEIEKLTQRDVKQWLARQNTTWTKMLIQYGFRDSASK
jgi:hypothetical protein